MLSSEICGIASMSAFCRFSGLILATDMMNFSPGFFLMGESLGSASRYRFVLIPFGCT